MCHFVNPHQIVSLSLHAVYAVAVPAAVAAFSMLLLRFQCCCCVFNGVNEFSMLLLRFQCCCCVLNAVAAAVAAFSVTKMQRTSLM
jgi:hypothetical protein